MNGLRGVFAGVLALIALEAVVSTRGAADRTAGAFGLVADLIARLVDPNVAAIPDLRGGSSTSTSAATYTPPAAPQPANARPKPPRATVTV